MPINIANELRTEAMKHEIIKLLEEKESFIGDCFMLKTPMKKQSKNTMNVMLYLLAMSFSFAMVYCAVFPKVEQVPSILLTSPSSST